MIIFCFLGVGPPCRSILCQFWLCEEAQCVYLRRHLGSPQVPRESDILNVACGGTFSSWNGNPKHNIYLQKMAVFSNALWLAVSRVPYTFHKYSTSQEVPRVGPSSGVQSVL